MSDVTKKEVQDLVRSIALGCPCCDALLSLEARDAILAGEARRVLRRALIDGALVLHPIEKAEQHGYDAIDAQDEMVLRGFRDSQQYAKGGE